jgi:hypothetical protein
MSAFGTFGNGKANLAGKILVQRTGPNRTMFCQRSAISTKRHHRSSHLIAAPDLFRFYLISVRGEKSMQLQDFAQVVRSKNAGPRRFTLDLIFRNDADYQRVAQSDALTAEKIAPLYGVATDTIKVIYYPLGRAIKIVVPRQIMSGDPGDRDVYGAQQHTPILGLEI